MDRSRVLVLAQDSGQRLWLKDTLEGEGFIVEVTSAAAEALEAVAESKPEVLLLDIRHPAVPAAQFCRQLRERFAIPVVIIADHHQREAVVRSLDAGADQSVRPPIDPEELAAHVRAVRRRAAGFPMPRRFNVGGLVLDLRRQVVTRQGEVLHLTNKEFALFRELVCQGGCVIGAPELLDAIGCHESAGKPALQAHVSRLRDKLGPEGDLIQSRPGRGYVLLTEMEDEKVGEK